LVPIFSSTRRTRGHRPQWRSEQEAATAIRESRIESPQPDRPQQSLRSHQRVAEAIRIGDPSAAAGAMREHIELVSEVALLRER
jgi:GntR family transcriptional repressor for pyruvate dehydrogenase complex